MTMTDHEVFQAIQSRHTRLGEGVAQRAEAVRRTTGRGAGWEPAAAELVAYLAAEVLPLAAAEEETLHQAARSRADLVQPVAELVEEHRVLADTAERLARSASSRQAEELATDLTSLFTAHVQKEDGVFMPLAGSDPTVDLSALADQVHHLTGTEARRDEADGAVAADVVAKLATLILQAAEGLAEAGQGDRACRLAAETWALLRVPSPRLAVRVTAKLHHLVRSVTAEPVAFTSGPRSGTTAHSTAAELDVRALAPAQRHEKIFAIYSALGPATAFVLVNDHDPKPLRYQFEAEHAGQFTWDPLEEGPAVWRVRIGRPARSATNTAEDPELDVRRLPHGQRHDIIFTSYQALAPGAGFVLVNDHDPVPLRYQFEAQFPDRYSWDYLQAGPDLWRVRIGRPVTATRR